MFSSRIIRGNGPQRPYTLEPLCNPVPELHPDVFRAVRLGSPEEEEAAAVEAEAPPAPPSIPEEEALRMAREAHAEGFRQGREEATAELSAACRALAQGLSGIASLHGQLLHDAEEDLLKLSVLIARKVMLREFACDPGILAGLVRNALDLACDGGEVVARLNPDEYALVARCREFEELLGDNPGVTLKPDPSIGRAGCLLETARGNIDAGVDAQLDEIFRRLLEERSTRREEPESD